MVTKLTLSIIPSKEVADLTREIVELECFKRLIGGTFVINESSLGCHATLLAPVVYPDVIDLKTLEDKYTLSESFLDNIILIPNVSIFGNYIKIDLSNRISQELLNLRTKFYRDYNTHHSEINIPLHLTLGTITQKLKEESLLSLNQKLSEQLRQINLRDAKICFFKKDQDKKWQNISI